LDLEGRVSVLEERMVVLVSVCEQTNDRSAVALREAVAARKAQAKNIELLNALRVTQAEHTETLAEHGRILGEHGRMLGEHGRMLGEHGKRLDSIESKLGEHGRILGEHGKRLDSIDNKLGRLAVGMYTIEGLLRRLVDEEGMN
jgi:hypothetical protein